MLVKVITPLIAEKSTMMRYPIDPQIKIAITLRFLATGESYESPISKVLIVLITSPQ